MTLHMDRCAVFVDAGYLYAAGGELLGLGPSRRNVLLDAGKANEFLVEVAASSCHLPALRTYWYDGARERIPTPEHQAIADLPNMKLRLGRLNNKRQQKGVDALIYHDLMTLARERAISEAFLLSGDEDLREGVRAAQEIGTRVTLVGILTRSGARNQSRDLVREADEVIMLTKADLAGFIARWPKTSGDPAVCSDPSAAVSVAATDYASRWLSKATDEELASLQQNYPVIPKPLDADLLRVVESDVGESLRDRDPLRRAARQAFWVRIGRVT